MRLGRDLSRILEMRYEIDIGVVGVVAPERGLEICRLDSGD